MEQRRSRQQSREEFKKSLKEDSEQQTGGEFYKKLFKTDVKIKTTTRNTVIYL